MKKSKCRTLKFFTWALAVLFLSIGSQSVGLFGQVTIQPLYQGREVFMIDHLFKFTVLNTSPQAVNGYLEISIEDGQGQQMATINSEVTQLIPGQLMRETDLRWASGLQLGFGEFARVLQQSGRLPFGNYVFCYQFIESGSGRQIGVNCQEKQVKIYGLPELLSPPDGAELTTPYPQLVWKPPLPLSGQGVTYSLKLVELEPGQAPVQAMATNFPLLDMLYMQQTLLPYPASGIPLDSRKTYAWQITAYYQRIEIGKTDIWTFRFAKSSNEKVAVSAPKSFPFVQSKLGGGYYIAENDLCFAYNNRAFDGQLTYQIHKSGDGSQQLGSLPTVSLRAGLNYVEIDEMDLGGLSDGEVYLLKITDGQGRSYFLEFEYVVN